MRRVFADTSYWRAILDRKDSLHVKAANASRLLSTSHIVTTNMVMAEVLNCFSSFGSKMRGLARDVAVRYLNSSQHILLKEDRRLYIAGLALYGQRPDKAWSLTDCSSFVVMQELGITEALTYDVHFEQAGFKALLRD